MKRILTKAVLLCLLSFTVFTSILEAERPYVTAKSTPDKASGSRVIETKWLISFEFKQGLADV
jgi:hypothetical protein